MLLDQKSKVLLSVERATNDLRKGFAVIIDDILALSPETASQDILQKLLNHNESINLIVTPNRLKFMDSSRKTDSIASIAITNENSSNIAAICGLEEADNISLPELNQATALDESALKLVRIAELIPSVITCKIPSDIDNNDFTAISANDIDSYKSLVSYELTEACRTKLVLKHHVNSEIVAYRPNIGGKEHYAIIIGNLTDAPLIRIHSSCYTGDLLESLACDCRNQLHSAIDLMHEKGGGIVLYMLQEGRGIGLINKLRAYVLKEKGLDTVDANEFLGFDDDERLFEPAAEILKQMNISQVQLLTNNPRKAAGLEKCGIKVLECVSHIMEANEHNEHYLKTKSTRLGHDMGVAAEVKE